MIHTRRRGSYVIDDQQVVLFFSEHQIELCFPSCKSWGKVKGGGPATLEVLSALGRVCREQLDVILKD